MFHSLVTIAMGAGLIGLSEVVDHTRFVRSDAADSPGCIVRSLGLSGFMFIIVGICGGLGWLPL